MPFIEDESVGQQIDIPQTAENIAVEAPSVGDIYGAAFRQENSFVSAASKGFNIGPHFEPEEGYDPYEQEDLVGYEMYAESFIDSKSHAETYHIKMMIDQELEDRKTLAAAGGHGLVAQMAAGVTDPIYLPLMLTGLGQARLGSNAMQAFRNTAAVGAFSEIPAEAAKQATQETRTLQESAINVGGAALLSGLLGAGVSKLTSAQFDTLSRQADEVFNAADEQPLSMGAAQVEQLSAEDLDLVNVGKLEQWGVSPQVRTQTSPVTETKQIASSMMETALVSKGNIVGKATAPEGGAVETRIKLWEAPLAASIENMNSAYLRYRQGMGSARRVVNDYVMRNRQGKLTPAEFREQVGRAMRRGDQHEIAEVAEAAQYFRKHLFDPLKDAAIEGRMLPRDIDTKTATSYLTRVYKTERIIRKSDEFDEISRAWLNRIRAKAQRKMDGIIARGDEPTAAQRGDAGITDDEIDEIVVSIRENITGIASGRAPYDVKIADRGPMKERVFNIPDKYIEDFLESDIDIIARQYKRTMAPDVELNRMFGEVSGEKTIEQIDAQYETLRKAATTENERDKLNTRQKADKRDLQAMWDRLRGTYRMPHDPNSFAIRAGRVLRDLNFVRMLGGMTLSAIPDMAQPIAVNGLKPVARGIAALATSPARFKMARMEAKKAAIGLDMVMNSRAASLAEINDIYASGTKFERGLRSISDAFSKLTLMSQWNTMMKQFSGVVTQDRMLVESLKWVDGTISKDSLRRMASAGIDKDMATRIAQQFNQYGDDGVIKLSNGHLWDDREALETFRAAMLKDVDRTIQTLGEGEKPLWTSAETGKLIFQFKSFAAASHHKVMLANLQHRDLQALNGFLAMTALGALTYGLKNWVAGREVSAEPEKLIVEALDRSGAMGYFWDINNMIEKGTRGHFGVNPALGAAPMSRYASRNIIGSLLGPSLGTAEDIVQIVGGAASGEFTKKEAKLVRQMVPGQNLFYMRQLLDELEEKAAEGLPR